MHKNSGGDDWQRESTKGRHAWIDFAFFVAAEITLAETLLLLARLHGYENVRNTDARTGATVIKSVLSMAPVGWFSPTLVAAIGVSVCVTLGLVAARSADSGDKLNSLFDLNPEATRTIVVYSVGIFAGATVRLRPWGPSMYPILRRERPPPLRPS
jgi:hypothetical protein